MRCDSCGEDMVREVVAVEVTMGGRRASMDQPGWYCWSCKLGAHSARDLAIADDALARLKGRRTDRPGRAGYRHSVR